MDIITLIQDFADGLLKAQDEFTDHPDRFSDMEATVAELSRKTAARFLSMALTQTDEILCKGAARKKDYKIQRHDQRTLITTVGDVTFSHTLFKDCRDGKCSYLLDELLHRESLKNRLAGAIILS